MLDEVGIQSFDEILHPYFPRILVVNLVLFEVFLLLFVLVE